MAAAEAGVKTGKRTGAARRAGSLLVAIGLLATAGANAQAAGEMPGAMSGLSAPAGQKSPSPPAKASVTLAGHAITIDYNAPSVRGRKIMGGVVPYGEVWRTGANPATSLTTSTDLMIGTLNVPAGKYTLFTLPSAGTWKLIVSKQTGEWGLDYKPAQDLGRTDMRSTPMSSPQEVMSISFENTSGNKTELHVKWEKTDEWVPVVAK